MANRRRVTSARRAADARPDPAFPAKLKVPVVEDWISAREIASAELEAARSRDDADPLGDLVVKARRLFQEARVAWARENGVDPRRLPPVGAPYFREDLEALGPAAVEDLEASYALRPASEVGRWATGHVSTLLDADGRVIYGPGLASGEIGPVVVSQ